MERKKQMSNLYAKRRKMIYKLVNVRLCQELKPFINTSYLRKIEQQMKKLPGDIPEIKFSFKDNAIDNDFDAKRAKISELLNQADILKKGQIFVSYKPNEKYSLGTKAGQVWGQTVTGSGTVTTGLILLNEPMVEQLSGHHHIYVVNLILHEVLHVLGLDHASGITPQMGVENMAVMNLGKFSYVGLSHDDRAGLKENYEVKSTKAIKVTVNTNGNNIALINKNQRVKSQGKHLINNSATFTHVKKGKYFIYVDGNKIKTITLEKDTTITI